MRLLLLSALTLLLFDTALAQRAEVDSILNVAERSYNEGYYENAELAARRLLESSSLQDTDRIACEGLIAFSLIAQGKPLPAREHFISILKINPFFELDPVLTSPKILAVFKETKLLFAPAPKVDSVPSAVHTPLKPSISFRAVLFPGWEQIHKGRTQTGIAFATLGAISLGSGIAAEFLRTSARKDYLSSTSPNDIADKYKIYNRYYHAETYSFILFALTYAASEIDLFTNGDQTMEAHSGLGPNQSATLVLTLHF
jgi:hypothetical protein